MTDPINNTVIVSEDIFMKASLEYCRRVGIADPFSLHGNWKTHADVYRAEMAVLAEKINALKAVGAI